jgi:Co/Zn/Cd efflux system component
LLDTAADAAAAAGIAVSGAIILGAGGLYWLDPATALVIAVAVGYHAFTLIRKIIAALRSPLPALGVNFMAGAGLDIPSSEAICGVVE